MRKAQAVCALAVFTAARKLAVALAVAILLLAASGTMAAEWQWAVDTGVKNTGMAFLWIPPDCDYVRGVIIGQQVILEKVVLEDPQIRAAAARAKLAIVFIVPAAIGYDDFGPEGKGAATFQGILNNLADSSGYAEIAQAPFLTIGHSGGAIFAWRASFWRAQRCFGVIGLHSAPIAPPEHKGQQSADGVPILDITGQYESIGNTKQGVEHHIRWVRGDLLAFRGRWEKALVSELVQPGCTHFNWDERLARYVAMFIEKAAAARILQDRPAAGQEPALKDIPIESGWLTDCTLLSQPRYPAARYRDYTGDPSLAFWHLDEELARENEAYMHSQQGKELQMLTFVENGTPLPPAWIQQMPLRPLPDGDGMTVKVAATFAGKAPPEYFGAPSPLGHADGPIQFRLFGGWSGGGEQVGPDTFRIKFDRFSIVKGAGDLMIMAWHSGDNRFAYAEQPAAIKFPSKNTAGKPQRVSFDPIPDQTAATPSLRLHATSDSGLPVEFCVIAGPAEIAGDILKLTLIPPRARWPVTVRVAAYQWGRSIGPLIQSATPVEQTFHLRNAEGVRNDTPGTARAVTLRELMQDQPAPKELIYKTAGGTKLKLFMFAPADCKPGDKRSAVVCIHGGGWRAGDARSFFPHARYFAARGAVGFSLDYRLLKPDGPTVADCFSDCKSALRYIRSHAAELGVCPTEIAVLGDSAGGHLASALGTITEFDDPADDRTISAVPDAMIPCNPIVDMTEGGWIKFAIGGEALDKNPPPEALQPAAPQLQLARQLSPLFQVRPGQPPTLLMHGLNDTVVSPKQARAFAAAMKKAGNRCDLQLIEGARHAFIVTGYTAPESVVVSAIRQADQFLISLGWLSGQPTLAVSSPPAWPDKMKND
ncbi:MAG: alpha/beta hydrolase [Planctomycetota bacterium]|nr:alpha/beta hydrolase [Planctomycetota bacterium]